MKGTDVAFTAWLELIDTVRDPSGTIPCNDLYDGELFRRQLKVKLFQDLPAVSLGRPDDGVGIMVELQ